MTALRMETRNLDDEIDQFDVWSRPLGVDEDDRGVYDENLTRDFILGLD